MAPKKTSLNGFIVFTNEWRAKQRGQHMSMSEATAAAGLLWEKMNAQQRGPYLEKAKQANIHGRANIEKLSCTGTPLTLIAKEAAEQENAERRMKRAIEVTVRNSSENHDLINQSYFFIMVNYFTKTLKEHVYLPAEISVAEYSLKNGVNRKYHTHINPAVSIYGHQYAAQQHSKTTHKLPLPPNAMGEKDLARIYNNILEFVRNKETGEYPPVYSNVETISVVESVLDYLQQDFGANNAKLKVYSIQYLFFILKKATCRQGKMETPKSVYITDAYFERDFFEYEPDISCDYHEECDRTKYCTLSFVTRWGFTFSDYMCGDIGIVPVPGFHVPRKSNLAAILKPDSSCNTTENYYEPENTKSTYIRSDHQLSKVTKSISSSPTARQNDKEPSRRPRQMVMPDITFESCDVRDNPWARSQCESDDKPDLSYFVVDYSRELDEISIPTTSSRQSDQGYFDERDYSWHNACSRGKSNVHGNASHNYRDDEEPWNSVRDPDRAIFVPALRQGPRGRGSRGVGSRGRGYGGGQVPVPRNEP